MILLEIPIRTVINRWDLFKLLSHAPDDEYDSEIEYISKHIQNVNDVTDLAEVVKEAFSNEIEDDKALLIAKDIVKELANSK